MKLNTTNEFAEVPVMVKAPLAIFSLTIGCAAILGAGLSFLKSALPAAAAGDYYHAAASLLGLIAATVAANVAGTAGGEYAGAVATHAEFMSKVAHALAAPEAVNLVRAAR